MPGPRRTPKVIKDKHYALRQRREKAIVAEYLKIVKTYGQEDGVDRRLHAWATRLRRCGVEPRDILFRHGIEWP